ncbi:MAG: peptidoglycan-binding domain-containing protein [Cyanobacteria bacterium P01_F01_bin.56]
MLDKPYLYREFSPQKIEDAIKELQRKLTEHGFPTEDNGKFNEETEASLKEFQRQKYLVIDGKVGPLTWAALLYSNLDIDVERTPKVIEDIKLLQSILHKKGLLDETSEYFSKTTEKALRKFQKSQNLFPDGKCDPRTWSVLLGQHLEPEANRQLRSRVFQYVDWLIAEQIMILASILLGMHFGNSSSSELPFIKSLIISYALTWIGPLCMEKIFDKFPVARQFPMFRFAPYVVIGLLWNVLLPQTAKTPKKFPIKL